MESSHIVLIASLVIAVLGSLTLAGLVGRKRRWRDPQRLFTWPQKQQLMSQAHGRCEHKTPWWHHCAAAGEHADHIIPWSRGGPTQLWNGQLLCARHNRRKSNRMPAPLYRWRLARRRRKYRTHV